MDPFQGFDNHPVTLNKYLYANADPINFTDPSGNFAGISAANAIINSLALAIVFANTPIGGNLIQDLGLSTERERTLKDVALGKFEARTCATSNASRCKASIPLIIFGADVKEATLHIFDAQQFGIGSPILSKRKGNHSRSFIRTAPECRGRATKQTGLDCDEYPFSSTVEGGAANYRAGKVSLRPINLSHNRAAGGFLNGFFKACGIVPDDPVKKWFGVVASPSAPTTIPVCAGR